MDKKTITAIVTVVTMLAGSTIFGVGKAAFGMYTTQQEILLKLDQDALEHGKLQKDIDDNEEAFTTAKTAIWRAITAKKDR